MKDNGKQIEHQIEVIKQRCSSWLTLRHSLGNECAYTDRVLEDILEDTKKLKELYEEQFKDEQKNKTFYVLFEQQGYEQLIVKVNAPNENVAYDAANEAYLGDTIDRYIVDVKDLGRYDCAIIDVLGKQLDYCDCIDEEDE